MNTEPPPPAEPEPPPLTPAEQVEAVKLFRHLLTLRASGVRQFIGAFDGDKLVLRAGGPRLDIANIGNPA